MKQSTQSGEHIENSAQSGITENVEQDLCSCGRKNCRPKQRNCHLCHAEAQGRYRQRQARDAEGFRLIVEKLRAAK